jgi:hypothetical protein
MDRFARLALAASAILPAFWWAGVPNAEQYLPVNSQGVLQEYSVTRPDAQGVDQKLTFNKKAQQGLKKTVDSLARP